MMAMTLSKPQLPGGVHRARTGRRRRWKAQLERDAQHAVEGLLLPAENIITVRGNPSVRCDRVQYRHHRICRSLQSGEEAVSTRPR